MPVVVRDLRFLHALFRFGKALKDPFFERGEQRERCAVRVEKQQGIVVRLSHSLFVSLPAAVLSSVLSQSRGVFSFAAKDSPSGSTWQGKKITFTPASFASSSA